MDILGVALSGLDHAQTAFNNAAARVGDPAASGDAVDLSGSAIALLQAKNEFTANIDLVKVADDIARTTISLLG
jgi:hypothetical protein